MNDYRGWGLLASLAARGINSHIEKEVKKKDHVIIKELAEKLDKLSKKQLDPVGLIMLLQVIWPNHEDLKEKKKEDVYLQTNLLAKDLACFRKFSRERQEELRDICIELSERAYSSHIYLTNFFNY